MLEDIKYPPTSINILLTAKAGGFLDTDGICLLKCRSYDASPKKVDAPDLQNVLCGVPIPIMHSSTMRARPFSDAQIFCFRILIATDITDLLARIVSINHFNIYFYNRYSYVTI